MKRSGHWLEDMLEPDPCLQVQQKFKGQNTDDSILEHRMDLVSKLDTDSLTFDITFCVFPSGLYPDTVYFTKLFYTKAVSLNPDSS